MKYFDRSAVRIGTVAALAVAVPIFLGSSELKPATTCIPVTAGLSSPRLLFTPR